MNTVPRKPLRRYLKEGLHAAAYWGAACGATRRPAGATVLMYHSVAPPSTEGFIDPAWRLKPAVFERQVRFLARSCRVVSLTSLVDDLRSGRPVKPRTVAITFDDGYLDTLQVAAPILARYGLPATLYLPTAYITNVEPQWIDRLYTMFASRTRDRLPLGESVANMSTPGERLSAYRILRDRLRAAGYEQRQVILEKVRHELRPRKAAPRLTLSWQQVRELVRDYPLFEIGGHSVHHSDLSVCDAVHLCFEVQGCIAHLKHETGLRPRHFSFPYGRATAEARAAVIDAGFESAVCSGAKPLTDERSDRFALSRLDPNVPMTQFKFWSSGAFASLGERFARV